MNAMNKILFFVLISIGINTNINAGNTGNSGNSEISLYKALNTTVCDNVQSDIRNYYNSMKQLYNQEKSKKFPAIPKIYMNIANKMYTMLDVYIKFAVDNNCTSREKVARILDGIFFYAEKFEVQGEGYPEFGTGSD